MKIAAKTLLLFHVAVCSTQVHGFAHPLLSPIFNSPQSSPCSNGRGHRGVRFLTQQLHASSDRTSVDRAFNLPRPPISALEETPSRFYDPLDQQAGPNDQSMQRPDQQDTVLPWTALLSAAVWTLMGDPLPAEAAAAAVTGGVVPSALWAYGHYLAMLLVVGSLVTERSLIQPQMSRDDEKALGRADLVYLASLVLLIVSGSFRATEVRWNQAGQYWTAVILVWSLSLSLRLGSPCDSLAHPPCSWIVWQRDGLLLARNSFLAQNELRGCVGRLCTLSQQYV